MKIINFIKACIAIGILITALVKSGGAMDTSITIYLVLIGAFVGIAGLVGLVRSDEESADYQSGDTTSMASDQIQQSIADEQIRQHDEFVTNESIKATTPFSMGGYDTSHDEAVRQNHSFFDNSFGGFGGFGGTGDF